MAPLLTAPYKLDSYVDKTTITLVGTPTIKRRQGTTEAGQLGVVIQLTVALSILLCPKTKSTMVFPRGIWHLQNPANHVLPHHQFKKGVHVYYWCWIKGEVKEKLPPHEKGGKRSAAKEMMFFVCLFFGGSWENEFCPSHFLWLK